MNHCYAFYMTLTTTISQKQYVGLMFMLAYKKVILKLLLAFNLLMIIWVVSYFMEWFDFLPEPEYPQYMAIFLISAVQPLAIYFTLRKNYQSSARLGKETRLTFNREKLVVEGHMFYSEFAWNEAYKLVEYKNWFLIYENTLAAIIIHKSDLTLEQEKEFKALIKTIPYLDVELVEK